MGSAPLKWRRSTPPLAKDEDFTDASTALAHISTWIVNADTKSALLAPGLTLLISAAVVRLRQVTHALPPQGGLGWTTAALSVAAVIASVFSALSLVSAMTPRISGAKRFSRYSFPDLAARPALFIPPLDREAQREEAWIQAQTLAKIAKKKLVAFRRALYLFCTAGALLAVSFVLS